METPAITIRFINPTIGYKTNQVEIFETPTITIGSKSGCTIVFEDDKIPEIHAIIEYEFGWEIICLSDTVPIFIDGQIIVKKNTVLRGGEVIHFGSLSGPCFRILLAHGGIERRSIDDQSTIINSGNIALLGDSIIGKSTYIDFHYNRRYTPIICFDSLFPSPFHPNQWQDLLVYCYNESALEKVRADLDKRLKDMSGTFGAASDKSKVPVPENALLTIVPEIKDVVCNPPQAQVYMTEDYHCVPFRVRYEPQSELTSVLRRGEVHGRIKIFLEGLLIGEIPIESTWRNPDATAMPINAMSLVAFSAPETASTPTFKHTIGYRYRKIFVSYSRKDTQIVKRLEKAYQVLGDEVWRDVYKLKSGTDWSEEIKNAILEADVFQLFWSENARQSNNVEQEWRAALSRELPDFIRPVYWEEPIAPLPEELKAVAFTFLEV